MALMTTMTTTMPSDTELRFTRSFKAPRALVYEAFTSPALLPRWMVGPDGWELTTCEVDLRAGGKFRYVWTKAGGQTMGMGGTFIELDPPGRIVHSELFDDDWTGGETRVTTELVERGGVTEMTLTVRYKSKDARDGAMKVGMASGMELAYGKLDDLLAAQSA
jgi:uncharacterized protein YndB with AHSA1/START domain